MSEEKQEYSTEVKQEEQKVKQYPNMFNFKQSENKQLTWLKIRYRVEEYCQKVNHDCGLLGFHWQVMQPWSYLFTDEDDYFLVFQIIVDPHTSKRILYLADSYAPHRWHPKLGDDFARDHNCTEVRWFSARLGAMKEPYNKKYVYNVQYRKDVSEGADLGY